ncbi:hypothetical protein H6G89_17825 [Oscillatoria sp. FACHB-1407]|uniref:hypothetical protein n=1 Tax=Oscillatoria sp. FACHB-1407 TaxID=2692847 RepID=UPI0016860CA2|nr:hypothetical protein [Oscillatoria sp. FACHB-1407]MBD2462902.1 hypothetical protein [Oscillatoria sp. FACHB-1407]
MSTESVSPKLRFPLRQYICQLFFSPLELVLWNPNLFRTFHNIKMLEQSLALDYIECTQYREFLERCLKISLIQGQDISKKLGDNHDHNQLNNQ